MIQICPTCNGPTKRSRSKYCSQHCFHTNKTANKSLSSRKKQLYSNPIWKENTEQKRLKTNYDKHGVFHPMQSPILLKKQLQSCFSQKGMEVDGKFLIGYEPFAYQYLLQFYDGGGILSGPDYLKDHNIKLEWLGLDRKTHRSFPDFYIQDEHMFVEIKSKYTRKLHDYKVMKAKEACNKLGYGYCIITVIPKKMFIQETYEV